jgi:hypothetical protein
MVRNRLCGNVNFGCSTLGNDGRVWGRVSVMEVHQIGDEKKHGCTARLKSIGLNSILWTGLLRLHELDLKCNRSLELKTLNERYGDFFNSQTPVVPHIPNAKLKRALFVAPRMVVYSTQLSRSLLFAPSVRSNKPFQRWSKPNRLLFCSRCLPTLDPVRPVPAKTSRLLGFLATVFSQ